MEFNMTEFITKDNKVIPINSKKGISSQTIGLSEKKILTDSDPEIKQAKELLKQKMANNPKNEIGLTEHRVQRHFGFDNGSKGTEEQRKLGNKVLAEVVKMEKENNPKLQDLMIHDNRVFNDYNGIQREFAVANHEIMDLIRWRKDGDTKTWKWLSPICMDDGSENARNLHCFDGHNTGFITDAYKNQLAITVMTPEEYMELSDPTKPTYELFVADSPSSIKTINELTTKMQKGTSIDTPFLTVDENLQVKSHEGRHRALSAIRAGILKIPVYVYGGSSFDFSDKQLNNIAKSPRLAMKPQRTF